MRGFTVHCESTRNVLKYISPKRHVLVLSWWKVLVLVIKYIQSTPARLWSLYIVKLIIVALEYKDMTQESENTSVDVRKRATYYYII